MTGNGLEDASFLLTLGQLQGEQCPYVGYSGLRCVDLCKFLYSSLSSSLKQSKMMSCNFLIGFTQLLDGKELKLLPWVQSSCMADTESFYRHHLSFYRMVGIHLSLSFNICSSVCSAACICFSFGSSAFCHLRSLKGFAPVFCAQFFLVVVTGKDLFFCPQLPMCPMSCEWLDGVYHSQNLQIFFAAFFQ